MSNSAHTICSNSLYKIKTLTRFSWFPVVHFLVKINLPLPSICKRDMFFSCFMHSKLQYRSTILVLYLIHVLNPNFVTHKYYEKCWFWLKTVLKKIITSHKRLHEIQSFTKSHIFEPSLLKQKISCRHFKFVLRHVFSCHKNKTNFKIIIRDDSFVKQLWNTMTNFGLKIDLSHKIVLWNWPLNRKIYRYIEGVY